MLWKDSSRVFRLLHLQTIAEKTTDFLYRGVQHFGVKGHNCLN